MWQTDMLICRYPSPLGEMLLAVENGAVKGLWFEDQKHILAGVKQYTEADLSGECFDLPRLWLNGYFAGDDRPIDFPLAPEGTDFQLRVWHELQKIPYGHTVTYAGIAKAVGCAGARAVGAAVGRNPVSIIIPCHRVVGSGGALTGYAGGLERKARLLTLEQERFCTLNILGENCNGN